MDFLIYVCLIILIGIFIFLNNFSQGYNPMLFVFVLSVLGLVMLTNSGPEIIIGTNTTLIFDGSGIVTGAISEFNTEPFTVLGFGTTNFFAAIFISFLLLSVTNIYFDRIEDMNIRQ